MTEPLKLAILISGGGSNLQAIIDAIEAGSLNAKICGVISNNPRAHGLLRATGHGLHTRVINHQDYATRDQYDAVLRNYLESVAPDYIVMAGFMRILSAAFIEAFEHRILNIHPSLLPDYKGLNTHQRVLDNAEKMHGVSIHLVNGDLDAGPVILQASYPVKPGASVEDLQTTGHQLEHQMYPQVLRWLADKRMSIERGQVFYEGALLEQPLVFRS
jgi:phosphoribosylglycinamide formyltransferase-1